MKLGMRFPSVLIKVTTKLKELEDLEASLADAVELIAKLVDSMGVPTLLTRCLFFHVFLSTAGREGGNWVWLHLEF